VTGKRTAEYFVVDCHTHYFPPQIFTRVAKALGSTPVEGYSGTVEDTLAIMEKDGVAKAIVLNFLPTAQMKDDALRNLPSGLPDYQEAEAEINRTIIDRVIRNNLRACEISREHPNLISFISVDPIMTPQQMKQEILDKVRNYGAKGLKLNPGMCRYFPYDRRLWPAYELAQEIDLPVASQSFMCAGPTQYSEPKYYGDVLSAFPKLRLVLTHSGMPFWDETKALAKAYPNVYFDMSLTLCEESEGALSNAEFISLVREVGVERFVYGSSFPWHERAPVLNRIFGIDLREGEKRAILGENALRICKITR
jgi:predicted TIM-barrel fold metal-dependent hydrolase